MALTASFLRQALDEPLRPFGFERLGRRPIWMREVAGLEHAVTVFSSHRMRSTEWYVIHPKVGEILHGKRTDRTDVGYANLIRGSANPHSRPGAKGDFTDADLADDLDATIEGVAAAARICGRVDRTVHDGATDDGVADLRPRSGQTSAWAVLADVVAFAAIYGGGARCSYWSTRGA